MASTRLSRFQWYDGRIITGEDMNDFTEAAFNRDENTRKLIGNKFSALTPKLDWVTTGPPSNPTLRLTNINSFENLLPIYGSGPFDFDPTLSNRGSEIGSNDVSGAGLFKSVIIGLSYTERRYDNIQDINNVPGTFRSDDGIFVNIISGTEESNSDPADPTIPTDVIPVGKIIRSFNDDATMIAGNKFIQIIQTDVNLHTTIIDHLTELTSTPVINTAIAFKTSGNREDKFLPTLKIDEDGSNNTVLILDDLIFIINGKLRKLSDIYTSGTDNSDTFFFQSQPLASLGAGSKRYLRAQLDSYNTLNVYLLTGTEPGLGLSYTLLSNSAPNSSGSSGGEISSNAFDVLLGVVTESVGPVYTVTSFDTNPFYYKEELVTGDYSAGQNSIPAVESITNTRPCSHELQARIELDLNDVETSSHPTNRVIDYYNSQVIAVKHDLVDIRRVGKYLDNSSGLATPATNSYFKPRCRVIFTPRFV